jgi:tetratricopeptide (TPR) repeat protein
VKQVGRELGVRYVLEGSLRKAGSRIRVTAQLVEAESGKHVWAERYDRELAEIFAVQDEITEAVAIAPAVAEAEQQRAMRKPPGSLDAWSAYQRGLWHLSKFTADEIAVAQRLFQQAVDFDPRFAGSCMGLADAATLQPRYLKEIVCPKRFIRQRYSRLGQSRRTQVTQTRAHGWVEFCVHLAAIAAAARTIRGYPEYPDTYRWLAAALGQLGRIDEAREALAKVIALRLPHSTYRSVCGRLGIGRKTTPTWSKDCERPDGRASGR